MLTARKTRQKYRKKKLDYVNSAATEVLPMKSKITRDCQLWKNDIELNTLLSERCKFAIGTPSYKDITKKVKK